MRKSTPALTANDDRGRSGKQRMKHDELFKKAMENPLVAREFFETHLPEGIRKIVDFSSLHLEKETFIEESLKSSASDLLFRVKLKQGEGYIYTLSEHQSEPDPLMAFRLLKYMTNIVARHMSLYRKEKHIPLVVPLIFYNGTRNYNAPLNLWDLFKPEEREIARKVWTEDHKVINVQKIPDEEFKKRAWSGIMEFFMKHIRHRDLLKAFDQIFENIEEVTKISIGYDYIELMFTYALTAIDESDKIELRRVITSSLNNNERGEEIMTSLAHHWEQEGVEKGILQGIKIGKEEGREEGVEIGVVKTAMNMLKQGLDLRLIAQCTGLPVEKIQMLKY